MKFIFIVILFFFLFGCNNVVDNSNNNSITHLNEILIGYCPTMEPYAKELKEKYGFEIKELDSASIVLNELNNNNIHIALIGRKAYSYEKINLYENQLGEGYTLVFNQKISFNKNNLKDIDIYTSEENLPEIYIDLNLIYSEDFNPNFINLINWRDFNDNELFIVMDGLNKDLRFRSPFLYSKNNDLIKYINLKI